MLSGSIVLLLASPAASANVDAQASFRKFCNSWCDGSGVANCDIGAGNIGTLDAMFPEESGRLRPNLASSLIVDAVDANRNTSIGPNCDEKDGNTCQQSGSDWGWCNYPQYKCMAKYINDVTNKQYSNLVLTPSTEASGFVFTHWIDNNSTIEQSTNIEFDESTSVSATMTLSNTVDVGVEISVEAEVPEVMKASLKETFDMSTTETSSKTVSSTQSWSITQPVIAPAQSTVKAELIIRKVVVSGDWTADVEFPDYAKIWCNGLGNKGHHESFVPASMFISTADYGYPTLCKGSTCTITAHFNGWHGTDTQVKLTQCPLGSRTCGSKDPAIVV